MRKLAYTLVDVFTDRPLAGNPLAVFTDATGVPDDTMQALARELNLSETVFLLRHDGEATARVRIFTPTKELPFAGHPLIGCAYVIGRAAPVAGVRLLTGVGPIEVDIERDGGFVTRCVMAQPVPSFEPVADAAAVERALRTAPAGPAVVGTNGLRHLLVPVHDTAALQPDLAALAALDADTVACFAPPAGSEVRARVFAPAAGVAEDPATGSAAGPLAAHLVERGLVPAGRVEIHQGVELGRPSLLQVDVAPGQPPRVGGGCVAVARGAFEL